MEPNGPLTSSNGGAFLSNSVTSSPQPDYSHPAVQGALLRLASINLIELCNEAKVERCRATRDLRSCGRYVEYVLRSCGHASLCAECSQRCDLCPVCRVAIPKSGDKLRLRLYYECVEAGLISKSLDERYKGNEDEEEQADADVQRLYSLFDVALDNNLVSLICHYVTDVCMDESAVSSDPVTAILLDEVVIKDWCKETFKNIIAHLRVIYNLEVQEMNTRYSQLLQFSAHVTGLCSVLEVLESSFKGTLSAQLQNLLQLQERILKTKQHLEIMMWCIRHQFLKNVRSRYTGCTEWNSNVRERKSAAITRSWPNPLDQSSESVGQEGSLFIEDALLNIEGEEEYSKEMAAEDIELASLQKNESYSFFRSQIEGLVGCYPFENLRTAVDILFLHGSSDLVLAKKAIFLYYLFDQYWTLPDEHWRDIIDDFAATFNISRHSLLESFTFYLLDDHTDEALLEACRLLPEISGPTTHPKIPQVLLERRHPDLALMVLRWSGRASGLQLVSLCEAVTNVRVRVECGLLTEAFTYQRMLCTRVKENKFKCGPSVETSDDSKDRSKNSLKWMETLVTEICFLCIRRKLVDRMIELPWNSNEEKYIHKCLLDYVVDDPSTSFGSLLVVYYLQRHRYTEAYQVNLKLQNVEQEFISHNSISEEVLMKMETTSQWRAGLIDKCLSLLPEVQQQQLKTGKLPEVACASSEADDVPEKSNLAELQEPRITSLLIPSSIRSSPGYWEVNGTGFSKPTSFETPKRVNDALHNPRREHSELGRASVLRERLFSAAEKGSWSSIGFANDVQLNDSFTPKVQCVGPVDVTPPSKEMYRTALRVFPSSSSMENQSDKILPSVEQNGYVKPLRNTISPYSRRVRANPTVVNKSRIRNTGSEQYHDASSKWVTADKEKGPGDASFRDDQMDVSMSDANGIINEDGNSSTVLRWRSDETSDEEDQIPESGSGLATVSTVRRGIRRSRFARR